MKISANQILPSQNFLKATTLEYISLCLETNDLLNLPPTPIVREDNAGSFIAVDGHNLLAVKAFLGEEIEVHLAKSPTDGLPNDSAANISRNEELQKKFDKVIKDRIEAERDGIASFQELIEKYKHSFHSPKSVKIHKAGAILIQQRKLLVTRSKGKQVFVAPGGKLEVGETPRQALVRELYEELQLRVEPTALNQFGTFYALAAGQEDKRLQMDVFLVSNWHGELKPANEIVEIRWVTSANEGTKLGSIFEHDVIPELKLKGLID
jgi:8-oxo-dGTP diphosphatase